jgi:hypothetical protein
LGFIITQHIRDSELLKSIVDYLHCGSYTIASNGKSGEFHVYRRDDIINKIIPFFDRYPLQGSKALDHADLRKAAEIVKVNGHLTNPGFEDIIRIKAGMNKGR